MAISSLHLAVNLFTGPHPDILDASVKPGTLADYRTALRHFAAYLRSRNFPDCRLQSEDSIVFASVSVLDDHLAAFFHWVSVNQRPISWALNSFWGLLAFNPRLKNRLHVAFDILKRIKRANPSRSPKPLTWDLTVLVASWLARNVSVDMAIGALLAFDCYLRVSELVGLRLVDVSVPRARSARVGIILRDTKSGRAQSVLIARPALAAVVAAWVAARRASSSECEWVFTFSAARFRADLARACAALGLPAFTPHSLRHGGASHDLLHGMHVDSVQLRGRWSSIPTARRYFQVATAAALDSVQLSGHAALGRELEPPLFSLLASQASRV
jgi:integrase